MVLVTTLFVPLMAGVGNTAVQAFAVMFVPDSSVKPPKFVDKDRTTFVAALRSMFKRGSGVTTDWVRNAFCTNSVMLSEPF
jgi:hypothetical protein